jgi:hypothetical protein
MSGPVALETKVPLFLSYGQRDAAELANRLRTDLEALGYEVWQDTRRLYTGTRWENEIKNGLRTAQAVIALLSPHSVRVAHDPTNPKSDESVCLDEISFARFELGRPIIPVMAVPCEPPLSLYRLQYVDMCSWRDSESHYAVSFKHLVDAIDAALQGVIAYRPWINQLKPWDFAALLNEKRHQFCGRQWLFDEIDYWRATRNEPALLLLGDPGVGKSAVVAELVHRNPGGQVLAYHFCQADTPATLLPHRFVQSLAAMIATQVNEYADLLATGPVERVLLDECARDPASAFEAGILTPLCKMSIFPDSIRYILVDSLDEALLLDGGLGHLTIVEVLATRLERLPFWLRIVATTRKDASVLDRLRSLRATELDTQDPRNLDDVREYLDRRLEEPALAEQLVANHRSKGEVQTLLLGESRGNFLYVQQAVQGIERNLYDLNHLGTLPPGLSSQYNAFFDRHFPDRASYSQVRSVLEVMVAAQEPLEEDMLARASGLNPDEAFPAALRGLSGYLARREQRYALFHKSFADWLTASSLRGTLHHVSPASGHRRLADACWAEYCSGVSSMSRYSLAHLLTHLSGAERGVDYMTASRDRDLHFARIDAGVMWIMEVTPWYLIIEISGKRRVVIPKGTSYPLREPMMMVFNVSEGIPIDLEGHPIGRICVFCDEHPQGFVRLPPLSNTDSAVVAWSKYSVDACWLMAPVNVRHCL